MELSDLFIFIVIFLVCAFFGLFGFFISLGFSKFFIYPFISNAAKVNILNLSIVLIFSFITAFLGIIFSLGFAADENAGEIVPYYLSISVIVSVLYVFIFYFWKLK